MTHSRQLLPGCAPCSPHLRIHYGLLWQTISVTIGVHQHRRGRYRSSLHQWPMDLFRNTIYNRLRHCPHRYLCSNAVDGARPPKTQGTSFAAIQLLLVYRCNVDWMDDVSALSDRRTNAKHNSYGTLINMSGSSWAWRLPCLVQITPEIYLLIVYVLPTMFRSKPANDMQCLLFHARITKVAHLKGPQGRSGCCPRQIPL